MKVDELRLICRGKVHGYGLYAQVIAQAMLVLMVSFTYAHIVDAYGEGRCGCLELVM